MQTFDIIKETKPNKTFRVASVIGKFDLQSEHIVERFTGQIEVDNNWQIGLIVGKSGTGKTTIAKQLFPDSYITSFKYNAETVLDDMPKDASVEQITSAFNSVGFSSPPSWLKPYSVLSNGQKMRVDLARAILSEKDLFVFDEFTSVVDRNVAQIGSFAMQKAIRKTNKKFIASIVIAAFGFINPMPIAFLLVCNTCLGNFCLNPSFVIIISLCIFWSSFSYFSFRLIILHPKNTLLSKYTLKYKHVRFG